MNYDLPDKTLTAAEEAELIRQDPTGGMENVLLHTLRPATEFVRRRCRNRFPEDEQFSIASQALLKASEHFSIEHNTRFFDYAKPFLHGGVVQAWRERDPVKFGETIPEKPDPLNPPQPLEPDSYVPDFAEIDTEEKMGVLRPYLAKLSEAERRVLILFFEAGYALVDIAKMCCVTRSAIQRTHALALRKLRNMLMDAGLYWPMKEGAWCL